VGVAATSSAASKAKIIDPDADVRIIQDENVVSYDACGIPYVIESVVKDFQELVEDLQMYSKRNTILMLFVIPEHRNKMNKRESIDFVTANKISIPSHSRCEACFKYCN
jgi:hypothetical protein